MKTLISILAGILIAGLLFAYLGKGTDLQREGPLGGTDLHREGPLGGGDKVTVEQARRMVPYGLPVPPTDEATGKRWGVWIDGDEVAFTWDSGLRFYVEASNLTEEKMRGAWRQKAKQEPHLWQLLQVRRDSAIGLSSETSSLTWIEDGLSMQLVSPNHSLNELGDIASQIEQ
jgi:hypothetical protein